MGINVAQSRLHPTFHPFYSSRDLTLENPALLMVSKVNQQTRSLIILNTIL